jgi:hypothetical protein
MYDIEAFSATPNPTDKHSDYLGEKTLFESSAILGDVLKIVEIRVAAFLARSDDRAGI